MTGSAAAAPALQSLRKMLTASREDPGLEKAGGGHDEELQASKHATWGSLAAQRSYWAIYVMGFALALDFTASLMSIQALYYVTGGRMRLYGLTFGVYTLSGVLVAPLYGLWSDKRRTFLYPCVIGSAINAVGNLVYAFTFLAQRWWVMLIGRAIAGIGSPVLILGAAYISQMTTFEDRTRVLGQLRLSQNIARMIGPFIGYLFLGLHVPTTASSTALKLFNWYTASSWVAFVVVAALAAAFALVFRDPSDRERRRCMLPPMQSLNARRDAAERAAFRRFMVSFAFLQFFFAMSVWAFYSNLFALFAGTFHGVSAQMDNWKSLISTFAGAVLGAILYRVSVRKLPHAPERVVWAAAPFLMFTAWVLAINYKGNSTDAPSTAQYYVACLLVAVTIVTGYSASEAFYSKKLTQYSRHIGNRWGRYLAVLGVANALGCFVGPLIAGAVTSIRTPSGTYSCGAGGKECCIATVHYTVDGCVLHRGVPWNASMAGVTLVIGLLNLASLYAHGSYGGLEDAAAAKASYFSDSIMFRHGESPSIDKQ